MRTNTTLPLALALAILATSVSRANDVGTLPPGIWVSESYGYVAQADRRQVQTFDVSAAGCVRGRRYSSVAFRDLYGVAAAAGANATLRRGPSFELLRREPQLPSVCKRPLRTQDATVNFKVFAATFAERYAFFAARGVDWAERTRVGRERLGAGGDLFDTMVEAIAPLADGHVTIMARKREHHLERIVAPGTAPDGTPWNWRSLRSSLRDYVQSPSGPLRTPATLTANRRVLYGRLAPNIAYLALLAEGAWAEDQTEDTPAEQHVAAAALVLDKIFEELADADGLILDLRVNSGGFDAVSMEIATRFVDRERAVLRKHSHGPQGATAAYDVVLTPSSRRRFAGPLVVLVGPNTVSAGESLALALAALPQVQIIGRPTRGEVSDAIPKTLPNGWGFTLSTESYLTLEGELVEVRGVQPDELMPGPATAASPALWGGELQRAKEWLEKAKR